MAKETKSIQVDPTNEQSTIELWQIFGWELVSSQEIYSKDSHLEDRNGDTYSVTTTTNYVKLVFSREKTMDHYNELVQLENQLNAITYPTKKSVKPIVVTGIVLGILGGYFATEGGQTLLGILGIIGGVGLLVLGIIAKHKNKVKYNEEYDLACQKYNEIIRKAKSLN